MYDLEEQEQIDELKAWWKQYGRMLIVLVVAACVGAAGTAGWQWYKRSQSEQASQLYGALEKAVRANDVKQIRELSGQLMDKFAGTAYGPMAALAAAKASYDGGDAKSAQAQLQWTIDNARDDDLIATARLRLAGVRLDEKKYDEALKLLDRRILMPSPVCLGSKGDTYVAQGKIWPRQGSILNRHWKNSWRHLSRHRAGQTGRAGRRQVNGKVMHRSGYLVSAGADAHGPGTDRLRRLPGSEAGGAGQVKPNAQARRSCGTPRWATPRSTHLYSSRLRRRCVCGKRGRNAGALHCQRKAVWRVDTKQPLSGGVGADGDLVVVATRKGAVLAYNLKGKLAWKSQVSSEVLMAPRVGQGVVVVRSGDGRIYALDAKDGKSQWEYRFTLPPLLLRSDSGVVIQRGMVLAGLAAGKVWL
jgi:predicted negative regulator of RcsB-dependent stress response